MCQVDSKLLATFHAESSSVHILDSRSPGIPVVTLSGHRGNVNALEWAPGSRSILATGADDYQVLIWNINRSNNEQTSLGTGTDGPNLSTSSSSARRTHIIKEPVMAWSAESEVNNISWGPLEHSSMNSNSSSNGISVVFGRSIQSLKVWWNTPFGG